jgi:hypothetical protein
MSAVGRARSASAVRTRRILSGMRFTDLGDGRAAGSTLLTHGGDGRGPAAASVVGADTDVSVLPRWWRLGGSRRATRGFHQGM